MRNLHLVFMFLILALGLSHTITYQNVSATGEEIVSNTLEINSNTANGPIFNNGDKFGYSIANIGDLNGDGISDIAVGATGDGTGGLVRGAIHIMLMNSDGSVSDTIEINSNTVNGPALNDFDSFGSPIVKIGNMNNVGISDIAVGAINDDTGGIDRGAIHVLLMNSNGSVSNTIEINSNTANGPILSDGDKFGSSIANIGDLNGDGTFDIAVGAPGANVVTYKGTVHIMFMNHNGSVSSTIEINENTTNGPDWDYADAFGRSIANIGDLNGDGISDIAVGDADSQNRGAIHVLLMNSNGSVSNTIEINSTTANGPALNSADQFGESIVNSGDLNNDGIFDIAVGAVGDDTGGRDRGAIHVLLMNSNGSVSNTIEINSNTANGPDLNSNDYFGSSIANIGDLNGDGVSDIVVGARNDDGGGTSRGIIHVMFLNNSALLPTITDITSDVTTSGTLKVGDTISFTLTLDSAEVGATIIGAYNSVPLSWNIINNGTAYTTTYTISEGNADQSTPLQITNVTITDGAGNTSLQSNGTDILKTIDENSPTISGITSDATSSGVLKVGNAILFTLTLGSTEIGATVNGMYNTQSKSLSTVSN